MKKIFAIVITFAMILSMGAMLVNAELPEGIGFAAGKYGVENAEDYSTVGDIALTWDPDASKKLDLSDGDMSDWAAAGYNMITVDASNMVSWVGDHTTAPAGWNINTYFVIDPDYLYIGFYVTDPAFAYATAAQGYNGDAFQVCIDFGGKMGDQIKEDPTVMTNNKNVFYSFSCVTDGAPLEIQLQESDQDAMLSEANGDGVKGSASKTDTGWCAEFALSLDMMFEHYKWKSWDEDAKVYIGSDQHIPFKSGCCLYYLDRSEPAGDIHWAAGSTNGIADDAGVPQVSWTAYDNGINLILEYQEDLHFTSEGIVVLPLTETTPEETEAPTEPETDAPETDPETAAPETKAPETEAPATDAPATEAPATEPAEGGCGSVIGFSAIAILAAAAAAIALKKD